MKKALLLFGILASKFVSADATSDFRAGVDFSLNASWNFSYSIPFVGSGEGTIISPDISVQKNAASYAGVVNIEELLQDSGFVGNVDLAPSLPATGKIKWVVTAESLEGRTFNVVLNSGGVYREFPIKIENVTGTINCVLTPLSFPEFDGANGRWRNVRIAQDPSQPSSMRIRGLYANLLRTTLVLNLDFGGVGGVEPPIFVERLSFSPQTVTGGQTATGRVILSKLAPTGGTTVNLSGGTSPVTVPATVVVPAGRNFATFVASTSSTTIAVSRKITASLSGYNTAAYLIVRPVALSSFTLSNTFVSGGGTVVGTLTLSGPAPSGGLSINVRSSNPDSVYPVPVTFAAGTSVRNFTIYTSNSYVGEVRLTATYRGVTRSKALYVGFP